MSSGADFDKKQEKSFLYDVAFSFLDKDKGIALETANLLKGRISTFIYLENQPDLTGKDGEAKFNSVFGEEARLVVVLLRDQWGETKWTRIEKQAIQNRSLEEGYDFTIFVVVTRDTTVPGWVPKNRIWYNYAEFGVKGLAASIENRVSELGGNCRSESVKERAARIQWSFQLRAKQQKFLESSEAIGVADREAETVIQRILKLAEEITTTNQAFMFRSNRQSQRDAELILGRWRLWVEWHRPYSNTIVDSFLHVLFREQRPGSAEYEKDAFRKVKEMRLKTSVDESIEPIWIDANQNDRWFHSSDLSEYLISLFLDQLDN